MTNEDGIKQLRQLITDSPPRYHLADHMPFQIAHLYDAAREWIPKLLDDFENLRTGSAARIKRLREERDKQKGELKDLKAEVEGLQAGRLRELVLMHARDDVETFLMEQKAAIWHCDETTGDMGLCDCMRRLAVWYSAHHKRLSEAMETLEAIAQTDLNDWEAVKDAFNQVDGTLANLRPLGGL